MLVVLAGQTLPSEESRNRQDTRLCGEGGWHGQTLTIGVGEGDECRHWIFFLVVLPFPVTRLVQRPLN